MRKALVVVLGLLVGTAVAVAATASQAGASSEFTVVSHTTNVEFITSGGASLVPSLPFVPGDRLVERADLTENGAPVGFENAACTVTFNDNVVCDEIWAFTNKGDLQLSTLVRGAAGPSGPPAVADLIVEGGTFAFRNAHGSAHAVRLPNGDQATTFAFA
jgi:hypothetical protein